MEHWGKYNCGLCASVVVSLGIVKAKKITENGMGTDKLAETACSYLLQHCVIQLSWYVPTVNFIKGKKRWVG